MQIKSYTDIDGVCIEKYCPSPVHSVHRGRGGGTLYLVQQKADGLSSDLKHFNLEYNDIPGIFLGQIWGW